MTHNKTELAVAALRNGTVIDHIPSEALFKCVKILGLSATSHRLTIGNNLDSERLGTKWPTSFSRKRHLTGLP